jgi:hypothetical protein
MLQGGWITRLVVLSGILLFLAAGMGVPGNPCLDICCTVNPAFYGVLGRRRFIRFLVISF